jgi:hypothetical protein
MATVINAVTMTSRPRSSKASFGSTSPTAIPALAAPATIAPAIQGRKACRVALSPPVLRGMSARYDCAEDFLKVFPFFFLRISFID